jgi:hypothetical protein
MFGAVWSQLQRLLVPSQKVLRNISPEQHSDRAVVRPPMVFAQSLIFHSVLSQGAGARSHRAPQAGGSALFMEGFIKRVLLRACARTLLHFYQWLQSCCADGLQFRSLLACGPQVLNQVTFSFFS